MLVQILVTPYIDLNENLEYSRLQILREKMKIWSTQDFDFAKGKMKIWSILDFATLLENMKIWSTQDLEF